MAPRKIVIGVLCALLLTGAAEILTSETHANDWPQFRGHYRDGISRETGLDDDWGENGPGEVWRVPIGEGYSGMSVVGNRLYTMYSAEGEAMEGEDGEEAEAKKMEYAAAFDATSGEELWRTVIGEHLDTEFGNGPRATPTVDGDAIYVVGSWGDLAALDRETGEKRWGLSLMETFGSQRPYWGFSGSALIDDNRLIIEGGGGEGKSYAALDKSSGEILWTSGDGRPGHNSPIQVDMMGETRYVYVAGGKLRCIDEDGQEIWAHDWPPGETHASPVYIAPDMIYASGAEGVGAQLIKVKEGPDGAELEELWKEPRLRNHFSTSVVHEGHIFGFDNATLKSVAVESGEMTWGKRGLGKGSLIYADGDLLVLSDRGELLLIEATGEEYREKARIQALEGRSWTSPTLAHGKLYLRNHTEMVSYDLSGS